MCFSICAPKSGGQPTRANADTPNMTRKSRIPCLLLLALAGLGFAEAQDTEGLLLQASSLSDLLQLVQAERNDPDLLWAWLSAIEARASGRLDGRIGQVLLRALEADSSALSGVDAMLVRRLLVLLPQVSDPALAAALYRLIPFLPPEEGRAVVAREAAQLEANPEIRGMDLHRRLRSLLAAAEALPSLATYSNLARLLPRISDVDLALRIDRLVRGSASAF